MNPCNCGYHNDLTHECKCSLARIQRYISKISGPLLDRIDIHIDVPAVKIQELSAKENSESSAEIRVRVIQARTIQLQRFAGEAVYCNAQMTPRLIRQHCQLAASTQQLLERAMQKYGLSARAYDRILKVARTIADLGGEANVNEQHLSEAVNYRTLDRNYWQ